MVKISALVLELEQYTECSIIHFDCDINEFAFHAEEQPWNPNTLYFCGSLPQSVLSRYHKRLNFILTKPTEIPPQTDLSRINLVVLQRNINIQKVYDTISQLITSSDTDEIISTILDTCKNSTYYHEILEEAYKILENPILLMDAAMNLVDHIGCENIKGEAFWERILSASSFPTSSRYDFANYELNGPTEDKATDQAVFKKIRATERLNNPMVWLASTTPEGREKREIIALVEMGESFFAYLKVLEYNRPITRSDILVINILCTILGMALWAPQNRKVRQIVYSQETSFLLSILDGKLHEKKLIEQKIHEIGFSHAKNIYLVCIKTKRSWDTRIEILFLQHKLEDIFECKYSMLMDNQIILLYDTDSDFLQTKEHLCESSVLLDQHHLIFGVSTGFQDICELPTHLEQAQVSLCLGMNLDFKRNIFFYDDLVFYHLLSSFADWPNISHFIHPAIKILEDMSRKGTDYLKTLQVYLDCNQDILNASKELFMHYNTLKYRIRRIIEQTSLDLKDHDVVLRLQLSFKILEMKHRNQ